MWTMEKGYYEPYHKQEKADHLKNRNHCCFAGTKCEILAINEPGSTGNIGRMLTIKRNYFYVQGELVKVFKSANYMG